MTTIDNKMDVKMSEFITKYDNIIKILQDILEIIEVHHAHREDILRMTHERICSMDA